MIQDADETLARLLLAELVKLPGCPIRDRAQVTFDPPTVAQANQDGEACVNLYLFDVRENLQEREEGFQRKSSRSEDQKVGVSRMPVRMDLSYLVSAHAGDDTRTEHRLLSEVLGVLLRRKSVGSEYLSGALEGAGFVGLAIAQPEHVAASDPKALWQALGGNLRPALTLVVTAPLNPYETVWTKRVREAAMGVGPPGAAEQLTPPELLGTRLSVTGIVAHDETEQPLAGVAVTIEGRTGSEPTLTDARGLFLITDLPAGSYRLRFHKRAFQELEMTTTVPASSAALPEPLVAALRPMNNTQRAAETAALAEAARNLPGVSEAERTYRVSLSGRLLLEGGTPAAGIAVRTGERRVVTDADGIYYFFDLPPGEHTVFAAMPGQGEIEVPAANT